MFSRTRLSIVVLAVIFCLAVLRWSQAPAPAQAQIDNDTFAGYTARSIGPAVMGGRISALVAFPGKRLTIYVGAAAGGIFKSEDGGLTFQPIFDKMNSPSIGAIADRSQQPESPLGRHRRKLDAQQRLGGRRRLQDHRWRRELDQRWPARQRTHLARADPSRKTATRSTFAPWATPGTTMTNVGSTRPRTAAKPGPTSFTPTHSTGCGDVAFDAADPNTLYASLWPFRRYPYSFNSGGSTGGIFKSTDGGSHLEADPQRPARRRSRAHRDRHHAGQSQAYLGRRRSQEDRTLSLR